MKPFEVIPLFPTPLYLSEVSVDDEVKNLVKNLKFMRMTDDNGDVSVDHYVLSNLKFKNLYDQIMMHVNSCLLYTSPSPRDGLLSRMPSSA